MFTEKPIKLTSPLLFVVLLGIGFLLLVQTQGSALDRAFDLDSHSISFQKEIQNSVFKLD